LYKYITERGIKIEKKRLRYPDAERQKQEAQKVIGKTFPVCRVKKIKRKYKTIECTNCTEEKQKLVIRIQSNTAIIGMNGFVAGSIL
jgi:hypothetical protein